MELTHRGLHKIANIFKCIFLMGKFVSLIQISLLFVSVVPIDNKSSLLQVMAWHPTGAKPLPEAMLTKFNSMTSNGSKLPLAPTHSIICGYPLQEYYSAYQDNISYVLKIQQWYRLSPEI